MKLKFKRRRGLTPQRSLKWPAREGGLGLRRTSGEIFG